MLKLNNFLIILLALLPCIFAGKLPQDCAEAVSKCYRSGIHQIQPRPQGEVKFSPLFVYCELDPNGGDAWTVFQRRQNGLIRFHRSWRNYKYGFGTLTGNFWLGLENLHALTYDSRQELWVQMEKHDGKTAFAKYAEFAVGNEDQDYPLIILGEFSGDAGNDLLVHKGMKFSTPARKNNAGEKGCAITGAWWYRNCGDSNLNGEYGNDTYRKGVNWDSFSTTNKSLKYTHMAIRKKNCQCGIKNQCLMF